MNGELIFEQAILIQLVPVNMEIMEKLTAKLENPPISRKSS